ncbi:Proline-Rich Protein 26 [Manis pentadactyla]|nr:Proline-Rich Protein 26 [Manis pentadactyla]
MGCRFPTDSPEIGSLAGKRDELPSAILLSKRDLMSYDEGSASCRIQALHKQVTPPGLIAKLNSFLFTGEELTNSVSKHKTKEVCIRFIKNGNLVGNFYLENLTKG